MKVVRLKRRETVFVCGKCLKRHLDGKAMRKALKARAKAVDAKVVRTSCLGVCPKRAVAVATRESLIAGRAFVLSDTGMVDAVPPVRIAP